MAAKARKDKAAPQLPAYEVETWPIARLKPYERNARTHGESQIEQLRSSFRKFGQVWPILVREDATIIAGHGRLEAAKAEGFTEIRVIVARGWSEEQCRAFGLLDNRVALNGEWDDGLLGLELADLSGLGIDLAELGFGDDEAAALTGTDSPAGLTDPDEVPAAPANPISIRGDLWALGPHRLLCGDCTKEDDVTRATGGFLADMIFTDPPYGVSYSGGSASGSISGDITQAAIPISFKQAVDHATKSDARLYFCGGSSNVQMYYSLFDAYLRKMPSLIVWNKGSIVLRRNNYHSQFEVIFYGWKGAGGGNGYWFGPRTADCASDVWDVKRDNGVDYLHPTQKPVALACRAIGNS